MFSVQLSFYELSIILRVVVGESNLLIKDGLTLENPILKSQRPSSNLSLLSPLPLRFFISS